MTRGLLRRLSDRLGPSVFLAEGGEGSLWPDEADAIKNAIPARQAEFAAGRYAARSALRAMGYGPVAIPMTADRKPLWPEGVIGSISHTSGLCFAGVRPRTGTAVLGLDAERIDRPLGEGVLDHVTSAEEREQLAKLPPFAPILVFSAKEAVYKAMSRFLHEVWAFDAVAIRLETDSNSFDARLNRDAGPYEAGSVVHGCFFQDNDHLVTALSLG